MIYLTGNPRMLWTYAVRQTIHRKHVFVMVFSHGFFKKNTLVDRPYSSLKQSCWDPFLSEITSRHWPIFWEPSLNIFFLAGK